MHRLVAVLILAVSLLAAGVLPAQATTADWRWQGHRVVVADLSGGYNPADVLRAARELNREQPFLRVSYRRGECPAGARCITVTTREDGMGNWSAKALTASGESCRVFLNGYWDGVPARAIKTELARCIGLRTAPEGVRSLMARTDPAAKLTGYDVRDLRTLYRR